MSDLSSIEPKDDGYAGFFIKGQFFHNAFFNKKVLVTGHTGFKGSWLSLWLYMLGAEVVGYALEPPTNPSLFYSLQLDKKITHITGDVRDYKKLKATVDKYRPKIIFHLAAQPLVRYSYAEPAYTYETNVMGTVNLLEAVRKSSGVEVVINITTDKCYQNKDLDYAYREEDPLGGFDPYSSSKACAELVTSAYQHSFFTEGRTTKIATVRAGNVVGGGDWAEDRIIPDCIRALMRNAPVLVRNPKAVRPWQHVLEPLSGYLWLAARLLERKTELIGSWNFGPPPDSHVTVQEVVERVFKEWGSGSWKGHPAAEKLHEAKLLKLDCSKARDYLGWQSIYDIETTLKVTALWYKAYGSKENMLNISVKNIQDYIIEARNKQAPWT